MSEIHDEGLRAIVTDLMAREYNEGYKKGQVDALTVERLLPAVEAALTVHNATLAMNREHGFEVFDRESEAEAFTMAILAVLEAPKLEPRTGIEQYQAEDR